MSKYLSFDEVEFADEGCLLAALKAIGFTEAQIEVGDVILKEYWGGAYGGKDTPAHVRIARQHFGGMDDLGFRWEGKKLVCVAGAHDAWRLAQKAKALPGQEFLTRLTVEYNKAAVQAVARRMRGRVAEKQEGKLLRLRLTY